NERVVGVIVTRGSVIPVTELDKAPLIMASTALLHVLGVRYVGFEGAYAHSGRAPPLPSSATRHDRSRGNFLRRGARSLSRTKAHRSARSSPVMDAPQFLCAALSLARHCRSRRLPRPSPSVRTCFTWSARLACTARHGMWLLIFSSAPSRRGRLPGSCAAFLASRAGVSGAMGQSRSAGHWCPRS